MSVEISPQELGFHRPFTVEVVENLKIKNSTAQPIAFKVKTTAPKQYCVRPNSGRVEPNREVEVQVILQAMKQEPPPNTKCKDKFLVQSVAITPDKDFTNLASIWDTIEKTSVQEKKIRVAFLDFENSAAATAASSDPVAVTPSKPTPGNVSELMPETATAVSSPNDNGAGPTESVATTSVSSEPSRDELKQQLLDAEKQIEQLKKDNSGLRLETEKATARLNEPSGLRQRTTGSTTEEKAGAVAIKVAPDTRPVNAGVPINITAALCLVSFMLGYLFF